MEQATQFTSLGDRSAAAGTSYHGMIRADMELLMDLFGDPLGPTSDGKTQCEWVLQTPSGKVVTIYDWKQSVPIQMVEWWHLGAKDHDSAAELSEYIEQTALFRERYALDDEIEVSASVMRRHGDE